MAAYTEQNHYSFRIYDSKFPALPYELGDQRWNKVLILHHALTTWASKVEYIVWMDADLIFLDFSSRIELTAKEYDWADVLLSRDPKIDNGIMNSGCIIAKNTDWTKSFLVDWWNLFDRNDVMDQLVFDYMWYTQYDELSMRIALLPADAINTNFPAWVNQQPWNQVLHLAGGSTALRATVFRKGSLELCRVSTITAQQQQLLHAHRLQRQLGITREYLVEIQQGSTLHLAMQGILNDINAIDKRSQQLEIRQDGTIDGVVLRMQSIKQIYSQISDALRIYSEELDYRNGNYRYDSNAENNVKQSHQKQIYRQEGIIYAMQWVYDSYASLLPDVSGLDAASDSTNVTMVNLLQDVLDVGFNLAQMLDNRSELEQLLATIYLQCNQLTDLTSGTKMLWRRVLYYKFKYWEFVALFYQQFDGILYEINALQKAFEMFMIMKQNSAFGSGNGLKDPFKEGAAVLERLGVLHCQSEAYSECIEYVQNALQLVEEIWYPQQLQDCVLNQLTDCKEVKYRNLVPAQRQRQLQLQQQQQQQQQQQVHQPISLDKEEREVGKRRRIVVGPHPLFDPGSTRVVPTSVAESIARKLVIITAAMLDQCAEAITSPLSPGALVKEAAEDPIPANGIVIATNPNVIHLQSQSTVNEDKTETTLVSKVLFTIRCFEINRENISHYINRVSSLADYFSSTPASANIDSKSKTDIRHDQIFDSDGVIKEKIDILKVRFSKFDDLKHLSLLESTKNTYSEQNTQRNEPIKSDNEIIDLKFSSKKSSGNNDDRKNDLIHLQEERIYPHLPRRREMILNSANFEADRRQEPNLGQKKSIIRRKKRSKSSNS